MDDSGRKRPKIDDVPIIGDYSEEQNARLRSTTPPARKPAQPPPPGRSVSKPADDRLVLDPRDVRRYRQRVGERERKGPVAKTLRYAPIAVVAAVALLVYLNFDTLRNMTVGFSLPTGQNVQIRGNGTEAASGTLTVEAPVVVGDEAPLTDIEEPAQAPSATAAVPGGSEDPAAAASTASETPAAPADDAVALANAAEPAPQPPPAAPEPELPPEPERYEFGGSLQTVSEADASAAVLVLRSGGRRAAASVTWWTTPGTATPGVDYADLGEVVLQFPAGAQNRTIRVPIVGDRVAEGPETFYIHFRTDDPAAEPATIEVIINDDD